MVFMASLGDPRTWVPYDNLKDCSHGFCTLYCPQWCYIVFPPPPPYGFPEEASSNKFSTLMSVIIAIVVVTLLIGSYYTFFFKHCWNVNWRRRTGNVDSSEEINETNQNLSRHEPWQVSATGLDDVSIKSIKAFWYKKGDGAIEGTDCPVCLGEFREDEKLRLLPKCSHAFHLSCIDTWLKSHSNCPLCRANVDSITTCSPLQSPTPTHQDSQVMTSSFESQIENDHIVVPLQDLETNGSDDATLHSNDVARMKDIVIEIRSDEAHLSSPRNRLSVADVLCISDDENPQIGYREHDQVGIGSSSRQRLGEHSKSSYRSRVLNCVMSPVAMKRSSSNGRFLSPKHSRDGNIVIPM
ncbi:hypothetical protein Sjap_004217 [Stephania japonica]|uniref:RING-type E3 ubiquitin transferase n=1 Tax=Stephania japonica TaxID=461633 RepID=A0AAP0K2S2_9MAGN